MYIYIYIYPSQDGDLASLIQTNEVNSRGLEIFTKSWLPEVTSPKAVVCFCHGYADTCSFFFEGM